MMLRIALLAIAISVLGTSGAPAQEAAPDATQEPTQSPAPAPERIQIGLSTDRIMIRSDFSGADLTIFGSVDNADSLASRINTQSETFVNVPASYAVSTTRALQDMADPSMYRQLSLGIETIHLQPGSALDTPATIEEFGRALRDRKRATGLYNERIGGVQFLSQNLFRATVSLAPNVPLGTHRARAFLFKSGAFIGESSASLGIYKAGFEQSVYEAAHRYSLLYGLFAVALAMLTGWVGSIVFRRD
jgi:hypothetical protein